MDRRFYRFGELKAIIQESANEFKPKFGNGYSKDTEKKDNREAYSGINKEVSKTSKAVEKDNKANVNQQPQMTRNTMADLEYDGINDKFKADAKAGLKGFTSANDEKNHGDEALGNASRNDEKFAKQFTDTAKSKLDTRNKEAETGLQARERKPEDTHLHDSVVESKTIPLLKFKHIQFISESQMKVHIPDDYKCEGKRFYMQDVKGNKYLVEWHEKPEIKRMLNEDKTNAELDRIKYLFDYKGKETKGNGSMRMNEGRNVEDMLGKMRKLMK
jgi:hypothetical protein